MNRVIMTGIKYYYNSICICDYSFDYIAIDKTIHEFIKQDYQEEYLYCYSTEESIIYLSKALNKLDLHFSKEEIINMIKSGKIIMESLIHIPINENIDNDDHISDEKYNKLKELSKLNRMSDEYLDNLVQYGKWITFARYHNVNNELTLRVDKYDDCFFTVSGELHDIITYYNNARKRYKFGDIVKFFDMHSYHKVFEGIILTDDDDDTFSNEICYGIYCDEKELLFYDDGILAPNIIKVIGSDINRAKELVNTSCNNKCVPFEEDYVKFVNKNY